MKKIMLSIIILTVSELFGQGVLKIKVMNERNAPIPFCSVTWGSRQGLVTNDSGMVVIEKGIKIKDTIEFSTIGYVIRRLSLNDLAIIDNNVILREEEFILPEVIVMKREKLLSFGTNTNKEGYSYFTNIGTNSYVETASLIKGYPEYSLLQKVSVFISKQSQTLMPFRIRLYANKNEVPGDDLTNKSIIVNSYRKGEWNDQKLDSLSLQLPSNGFFISIEWLITNELKDTKLCIGLTDDIADKNTFIKTGNSEWKEFNVVSPRNSNPSNVMIRTTVLSN